MSSADSHFPAPPAAHLPAAVLRQYAAGTLTAPERRRVERHTLDCALCADALEGYQQAAPAATSPAALAELRQRLHARVEAEPAPARGAAGWWMAAAAAVLVLLVAVGVWQQRPARPAASVAQVPRVARAAPPETPLPAAPSVAATPKMAEASANEPAAAVAAAPVKPRSSVRRAVADRPRRPKPVDYAANTEEPAEIEASGLADVQGTAAEPAAVTESVAAAPVPAEVSAPAPAAKLARGRVAASPVAGTADTVAREAKVSMAATAPAAANAPAAVLREESSKRKSELPPAPALAPFPNGGYPAFRSYLLREQQLPPGARHVDGTVKLKFTVEADGTVHNIQVVRGLNEELDAEAIRLVCEGPAWRPGIVNGRRATQTVRVDVPFH